MIMQLTRIGATYSKLLRGTEMAAGDGGFVRGGRTLMPLLNIHSTLEERVLNAITPRKAIFILTESTGLSLGIFAQGYQLFNDLTFRNNKLTRYFAITLNKARLLLIAITFLGINLTN